MRTFIGIPIPKELRKKVYKIGKEIEMRGVKTVKPENLHWTVKFFGDLDEKEIKKVKEIMDSIEKEKIEIEVRGIGTFPGSSYVKIIWVGVSKGRTEFYEFLKEINKKFSGIGKNSSVIPHLTIGRVKFIKDKENLLKKIDELRNVRIGRMKINKIVLYESQLTTKGPVYKEIKKIEW
ncbi:MAG: RNA 2',3'-cyclic phosphodiesterase [Candidatus Aenigmarchaeota archaeon]|nr:RNA 2',3'-cyclic phosphodiesterase [Candidatus Aenigmarchaeota archaeon]